MQKRLISLDLFRGIAVILALFAHFLSLLSSWYSGYVKAYHFNDPAYQAHHQAFIEGRLLPIDALSLDIGMATGMWVNHLYLFLAGFNICLKSREEVGQKLKVKLQIFLALFLFFTLETSIISQSFGESLSIYPLHMWMIVLALLNVIYVKFGPKAFFALFLLSFLRFIFPAGVLSDGIEDWMQINFHKYWEYDARIEYFIGTGALGSLAGYCYTNRENLSKRYKLNTAVAFRGVFLVTFSIIVLFQIFSTKPVFDYKDFYSIEHFYAKSLTGSLFIYSCCLFFTALFLKLEENFKVPRLPVLYWVGAHSLFVFAFHRILFVHVLMPAYEWFSAKQGHVLVNSFPVVSIQIVLCLLLTYGMQRLKVFEVIVSARGPTSESSRQ